MRAIWSPVKRQIPLLMSRTVRRSIFYFLLASVLLLQLAYFHRFLSKLDTLAYLLLFMGIVIVLGFINYWLLEKLFEEELPDWMKAVFTLTSNGLGLVLFLYLSAPATWSAAANLLIPALFLFSFPWFFIVSVKAVRAIPPLEYLPLQITNLKDIVAEINWAEDESRGIVWEFEQLSEMNEEDHYWVRTHTPHAVENKKLKDLFKGLLSLHNHNLSPGRPIHFEKEDGYYGWRFFRRRKFLFGEILKPLNPEKNLQWNGVHFQRLSRKERTEMNNLRKGLINKFKRTKILIRRIHQQ